MGIGGFFRRLTGGRASAPTGLVAANAFRALLDRERLRSDRSGAVFSLVAFTSDPPADEAAERTLAGILERRLRATDDAGFLDDGRIAALLPETRPHGAWSLADDVCRVGEELSIQLECQVFAYPPQDSNDRRPAGENERARYDDGDDDRGNGAAARRASAEKPPHADSGAPQKRVESLEVLLARALPGWKRTLDMLGASFLLVAATPLMLLAALVVKLTSRGPVLFAQRRDGLGGRPFTMYKFRTMTVGAEQRKADLRSLSEQDGPAFKMTNDPRVTRVGRLLRATSIDELPQLWNVLRGEMSLVGPRPLPCDESSACEPWQRRRLTVTPGLTCIWQVEGRSLVTFAEWARMDLQYVDRRTLLHDLKLLVLTLPALLTKRGK